MNYKKLIIRTILILIGIILTFLISIKIKNYFYGDDDAEKVWNERTKAIKKDSITK